MSNFEKGQGVNINFVPNSSLQSLFPKICPCPVTLDVVQEWTSASGHYVVTEQPLIINCEKYLTLCLNINRWTYTVGSAIPLSLSLSVSFTHSRHDYMYTFLSFQLKDSVDCLHETLFSPIWCLHVPALSIGNYVVTCAILACMSCLPTSTCQHGLPYFRMHVIFM